MVGEAPGMLCIETRGLLPMKLLNDDYILGVASRVRDIKHHACIGPNTHYRKYA